MILQQGPNEAPLVRELQLMLKRWGFYSGSIDDTFGPETEKAVIAFQKALGLNPNGIEELLKHRNSSNIKVVIRLVQVQSQIYNQHFAPSTVTARNFSPVASTSKI